jgi:ketosteroid isomerase-like protein
MQHGSGKDTMTEPTDKAAAAVLAADEARYAAMIAQDYDALGKLLADDLLYTHSTAVTDTKAEYLAALRSGKYRYKAARTEGVTVRVHGTIAILNGRGFIQVDVDGVPKSLAYIFVSVWVRTPAGWQMTALQSTAAPKA